MSNQEEKNITKEVISQVGKNTTVLFTFDTTGSMLQCINDVRNKLRDLAELMFQDIPNLKLGFIAHGDYCDKENCLHLLDFTNNIKDIMNFINSAPNTSGGDAPECYELVLNKAATMSWPESGGVMIMIGDDVPHSPEDNPDHLDWKEELKKLKSKNIKVFPLQCMQSKYRNSINNFWESLAEIADTSLLLLNDFSESSFNLGAVAYAASGDEKVYSSYMTRSCVNMSEDTLSNTSSLRSKLISDK